MRYFGVLEDFATSIVQSVSGSTMERNGDARAIESGTNVMCTEKTHPREQDSREQSPGVSLEHPKGHLKAESRSHLTRGIELEALQQGEGSFTMEFERKPTLRSAPEHVPRATRDITLVGSPLAPSWSQVGRMLASE